MSRAVFGVIVAGLVVYLSAVGLDKADKLGSSIGGVAALIALVAPYLSPRQRAGDSAVSDEAGAGDDVAGDSMATLSGDGDTGVESAKSDPDAGQVEDGPPGPETPRPPAAATTYHNTLADSAHIGLQAGAIHGDVTFGDRPRQDGQ